MISNNGTGAIRRLCLLGEYARPTAAELNSEVGGRKSEMGNRTSAWVIVFDFFSDSYENSNDLVYFLK